MLFDAGFCIDLEFTIRKDNTMRQSNDHIARTRELFSNRLRFRDVDTEVRSNIIYNSIGGLKMIV